MAHIMHVSYYIIYMYLPSVVYTVTFSEVHMCVYTAKGGPNDCLERIRVSIYAKPDNPAASLKIELLLRCIAILAFSRRVAILAQLTLLDRISSSCCHRAECCSSPSSGNLKKRERGAVVVGQLARGCVATSPCLKRRPFIATPPWSESAYRNSDAGDMPRTGDLPFVHTFSTSMDKEAHNEDAEQASFSFDFWDQ